MATYTSRLTPTRKKHVVRRNGKIVRVYYTYSHRADAANRTNRGREKKASREVRVPSTIVKDMKNHGLDFVKSKYGTAITPAVERVLKRNTTSTTTRRSDKSQLNAPPEARDGYIAQRGRFKDGGPSDQAMANANANAAFKRKQFLNLENDEERAQGSHHDWAQATTVSSLINTQLRKAANAPLDYWETWAQGKSGQTQINDRGSSQFGIDVNYQAQQAPADSFAATDMQEEFYGNTSPMQTMATSNNMGAFGTNAVMDPSFGQYQQEGEMGTTSDYAGSGAVYNPWSEGEGGQYNLYGPSPASVGQSTMEAMALANAFFAPQRVELAYELGDMETDMRRLAVNLGRQVDDPVLQAKLYKEGMRAVRTMDTQQNTYAFQMAEQRRKEEIQNYQFYDSLAQQEYNLRKANEQFLKRLELDNAYFGLKKDELGMLSAANSPADANTAPVDGTVNSPVTAPPTSTTAPTAPTNTLNGIPLAPFSNVGPGNLVK